MKDRELDQLIQQMFGDADGPAPQNDAARKEAAFLTELKTDLKALNDDIPECQMSVDRLRHAVLNSTQREASRAWRFSKVFGTVAGAAAAVMAVALVINTMNPSGQPASQGLPAETVAMSTGNEDLNINPPVTQASRPQGVATAPKQVESQPEDEAPKRSKRLPRKSNRGEYLVARNDMSTPSAPVIELSQEQIPVESSRTQPAAMSAPTGVGGGGGSAGVREGFGQDFGSPTTAMTDASVEPDSTVVIVDRGAPRAGRAGKATEVKRDEDVVFGG